MAVAKTATPTTTADTEVNQMTAAEAARLSERGTVRVPAFGDGFIQVSDRSVVIREMLDAFFDPAHKDHRSVSSFKKAYVEITGDK